MRRFCAVVLATAFPVLAFPSTWTELGPKFPGRVSAIAATDALHVWVATPGGGVWKSSDGGASFTWAGNYALGDFTAVNLALDRITPSRMYLRTWSGVLVSTDGAAHWTRTLYSLPQGDTPYPYPTGACSSWPACPPNADNVPEEPGPWAQTVFSPTQSVIATALPCQGLQYSIDGGNHFTQLWPFPGPNQQHNPDNCINSIAIDGVAHRVWFTTMGYPTHIYRSSAGWTTTGPPAGMTWDLTVAGIAPGYHAPAAIAWGGGSSADRVMALVYSGSSYIPYLFGGGTWTAKPITSSGCVMRDARALVAGGTGNDFYVGGVTFAYTTNGGDAWTCPSLPTQYADIRAIFPSASASRLWIGGDQSSLGAYAPMTRFTWSPGVAPSAPTPLLAAGIASWQAYSVAKATGNRILVGAQDTGVACTDDGGLHWSYVSPTDEAQSVVWARSGGANRAYAFITKTDMFTTGNASAAANCGAMSWSYVPPPDPLKRVKVFSGPRTMAVDPLHESKVFAMTGGRVLYSLNAGGLWSASDIVPATSLTAIFVDEAGVVYVGTLDHGVYTCSDTTHYCDGSAGAGTWTPFALNPGSGVTPPWIVTAIAESNAPPAPRTFWIATTQGVYRRLAGTSTWSAVDALNLYPYSDVVVDPTCRTRIYSAMGFLDKETRTRGGVHVSTDNGAHWTSITSGFPLHNVPITEVLVDPADARKVYVSTYGRGLWLYTWDTLPTCAP